MYITCQQEMDFGEAHKDAMNGRLHKYFFRSLPQVNQEANQWLREHTMDCIVWAPKDDFYKIHYRKDWKDFRRA